jgi:hypothetical protein
VGASISPETSNRIEHVTPIRAPSVCSVRCHSGGAGRTSLDRIRAAIAQPPASLTQNASAPMNQNITTHDHSSAGNAPALTLPAMAVSVPVALAEEEIVEGSGGML